MGSSFDMKMVLKILFFGVASFALMSCARQRHCKPSKLQLDVYHAYNGKGVEDVPSGHPLRESFDRLTGYDHYKLLTSTMTNVTTDYATWLVPDSVFSVKLQSFYPSKKTVDIELFQKKKSIFKASFFPKKNIPLIITGPYYNDGRLLLVVTPN
jgi:hypothetical protein